MQFQRWIRFKLTQFIPQSPFALAFLIITVLESSIDIVLESILIDRLNLIHPSDPYNAITPLAVYLGIFIIAHLFQLFVATDALRHKNTIQLIGLCSFNFCFLVYAILQVPEIHELESHVRDAKNDNAVTSIDQVILMIIPICIGISQIAFMFLTWHLYKEFGWQIYRKIGADRRIKRFYLVYQILMCLLKFDFFFLIGFSIQLVLLVPTVGEIEKWLTIVALPVTLVLLILGYYSVRKENKTLVFTFMVGLLSGSSYFIYKLLKIWQGRRTGYENVFKSLTLFSISCLLLTLVTFTTTILCLKNFGQGLKVHVNRKGGKQKSISGATRLGGGRKWIGATNSAPSVDGVEVGGQPSRTYKDSSHRIRTGNPLNLSTTKHDERMNDELSESESQTLETFKTNENTLNDDPLLVYNLSHQINQRDPPPKFIIEDENPAYSNNDAHTNNYSTRFQPHLVGSDSINSSLPQNHHHSFVESTKRMSID